MEQLLYILPRAIAIGVIISAPMGPIGMLIIQRALTKGRWSGMFTGVGAALSDLIYCLITDLGLSVVDYVDSRPGWLTFVGAGVIVVFALYLFRNNPTRALKTAQPSETNSYWTDFGTGFLLTFSNPFILIITMPVMNNIAMLPPQHSVGHYIFAFACVLLGALMWWNIITWLVSRLRRRFNVRSLWLINRIVACILLGMAIYIVLKPFI
ncbi:MAG: LysE family translocator [Muribaculaceae bacterium]